MERVTTTKYNNSDAQCWSGSRRAKKRALHRCIASGFHVWVVVSMMVALVVIVVLVSVVLQHLSLPARLFSGFERWMLLLLTVIRMKIILIRNAGGCTVAIADGK